MQAPAEAMERAIAIVTAYCSAVEDEEEIDDDAGGCLFDILYDLEQPLINATCEGEEDMAREAFSLTVAALAGIISSLLDHIVRESDIDKFVLLAGIAESHYRSNV